MRCHRCELENIPGLQRCMRCGSVLEMPQEKPIPLEPPRMGGWKKPFRSLMRHLRRQFPLLRRTVQRQREYAWPDWLNKTSRIAFFGAFLSLVPGLAHLIQKRLRIIRWWVAAWAVLLAVGLFLYGSIPGLLCLGLALGIHAWIAVHSALLEYMDQFLHRMLGFMIVLAFYYIVYIHLGGLLFSNIDGSYAIFNAPTAQIQEGDFLLGLNSRRGREYLHRGSIVLTRLAVIGNHGLLLRQRAPRAYVQIADLPGETIAIDKGGFKANEKHLDKQEFAVPQWLQGREFSAVIPENSYFIIANYQGTGYNSAQIISVCIVPQDRIEAKAVLRWIPLGRRGFIRDRE